ncbi:photosystem reaction center subunit H [bacterium BFN5]|nr:photosystem reaction center subunit H [bacterium BFN5]QJW44982.1 photosystem reaction center subunit H [bacterium BFN5]
MKKSVEILGLPIISLSEGRELGNSRFLVINPDQGVVAALVVEDEKWYKGPKLLPFSAVTAIGEYAITINSSSDILPISEASDLEKLLDTNIKVIGTKVITKSGKIQGKIIEIIIDDAGSISLCELEDSTGATIEIPASSVFTYGKDVTIITDNGEKTDVKLPKAPEPKVEIPAQPVIPVTPVAAAVAQEPTPAPVAQPTANEKAEANEESSKKFDDRHRKYLLGKKASRRIETDNGVVIVEQGAEITEEVLQKAKLAGKFVELSMNIQ